jgi:hypothetical protein
MKAVVPDIDMTPGPYLVTGSSVDGQGGPKGKGLSIGVALAEQLQGAMALFRTLRDIEEAYDVVMGNYLELEEAVLRLAARDLAHRHPFGKVDHFDTARRTCHRALSNLLASARAFDNQSCGLISELSGNPSADLAAHKAAFSTAYDAALGYRVMESLRNHAQHQGVSVSGVAFRRRSLSATEPRLAVTVRPYIAVEDLRRSPKFKRSVLCELEAWLEAEERRGEDSFPIIPFVRDYIAGLSSVIAAFRQAFKAREETAANLIYLAFYHHTGFLASGGVVGLDVQREPDGEAPQALYFGTDLLMQARSLRGVNGHLPRLSATIIEQ